MAKKVSETPSAAETVTVFPPEKATPTKSVVPTLEVPESGSVLVHVGDRTIDTGIAFEKFPDFLAFETAMRLGSEAAQHVPPKWDFQGVGKDEVEGSPTFGAAEWHWADKTARFATRRIKCGAVVKALLDTGGFDENGNPVLKWAEVMPPFVEQAKL